MTEKIKFPYRYDIVGSFLRPEKLKEARVEFTKEEISEAELKKITDKEIAALIDKEKELGLKAVTDGEFPRSWWHLDFLWGLKGVAHYDYKQSYKFHGAKTRTDNAELAGKVAYNSDHPFFADFETAQKFAGDTVVKQTIPSPTMLFRDNRSDNWPEFYDTREEYLADLSKAYRLTIKHFADLGCKYLQIDDTTWAFLISKLNETADDPAEHEKYVQLAEDAVTVINGALKDRPDGLTITTHICRGNFKSTFLFSGGYEPVAKYLAQLDYDGYFLEYDTDRAGDFVPLRKIWNNRENVRIVLGLVTSKNGELEDEDRIIARINEASKFVPLDNLCLSPQCGFASTEEGNVLTEEQEWAKLKLIEDIANKVWK
ncbi:vitamin B12 independent methionine synthase [Lactobacillus kalixensis]|uniref:Methionine synthase, vitamin-B12 independent n=1 Tax=Lactobacillus kalixensis DSM 16043 TaxID=1423763 RepID=A0A0R1UE57_9LACO|nr:vitamin B12 independent methionine synthase [Lactobacillus kalixensis]KRL89315.1 methionine synthase, vitamin-B12 independent [Lactobacillus kalixensis DSM 16043]